MKTLRIDHINKTKTIEKLIKKIEKTVRNNFKSLDSCPTFRRIEVKLGNFGKILIDGLLSYNSLKNRAIWRFSFEHYDKNDNRCGKGEFYDEKKLMDILSRHFNRDIVRMIAESEISKIEFRSSQ